MNKKLLIVVAIGVNSSMYTMEQQEEVGLQRLEERSIVYTCDLPRESCQWSTTDLKRLEDHRREHTRRTKRMAPKEKEEIYDYPYKECNPKEFSYFCNSCSCVFKELNEFKVHCNKHRKTSIAAQQKEKLSMHDKYEPLVEDPEIEIQLAQAARVAVACETFLHASPLKLTRSSSSSSESKQDKKTLSTFMQTPEQTAEMGDISIGLGLSDIRFPVLNTPVFTSLDEMVPRDEVDQQRLGANKKKKVFRMQQGNALLCGIDGCEYHTLRYDHLINHRYRFHTKQPEPYKCSICHLRVTKLHLREHNMFKHPENVGECVLAEELTPETLAIVSHPGLSIPRSELPNKLHYLKNAFKK